MRQLNGSELFGADDPRSASIGIIEVAPEDKRQSIITAIVTQEKLQRKQTLIILPEQMQAFRRASDFEAFLETIKIRTPQPVFILPAQSRLGRIVRQQNFPLFPSLQAYVEAAHEPSPSVAIGPDLASGGPTVPLAEEGQPAATARPETDPNDNRAESAVVEPDEKDATHEAVPGEAAPRQEPVGATPTRSRVMGPARGARSAQPARSDPAIIQLPSPSPAPTRDEEEREPAETNGPTQELPIANVRSTHALSRRRRAFPLFLAGIAILLIIGSILSALTGLGPFGQLLPLTATITIAPDQRILSQRYQFIAVTENVDPAKQQVQARFLSSSALSRTQTARATGVGIVPAHPAQGTLTFYNALAQAQTLPAGTVLSDKNGIQLSIDQAVTIPAATPPNEGSASVAAHAITLGERGNIAALNLNAFTCCHAGITVTNAQPFSGGADQSSYTYLQQSDIDGTARSLQTDLAQIGEKAVQVQVLPEEQILDPAHCNPHITADHSAGERVMSTTVTETVQCLAEVYNRQSLQMLASNLLLAFGQKDLGKNYAGGHISTKILGQAHPNGKGEAALQVVAQGLWSYQVSDAQKRELLRLAVGKDRDVATAILQRQSGIRRAEIALSRSASRVLPDDLHAITLRIQLAPDSNNMPFNWVTESAWGAIHVSSHRSASANWSVALSVAAIKRRSQLSFNS